MNKTNKKQKIYNARILIDEEAGTVKIMKVEQKAGLNQFRDHWRPATSRDVARLINRSKIIIK